MGFIRKTLFAVTGGAVSPNSKKQRLQMQVVAAAQGKSEEEVRRAGGRRERWQQARQDWEQALSRPQQTAEKRQSPQPETPLTADPNQRESEQNAVDLKAIADSMVKIPIVTYHAAVSLKGVEDGALIEALGNHPQIKILAETLGQRPAVIARGMVAFAKNRVDTGTVAKLSLSVLGEHRDHGRDADPVMRALKEKQWNVGVGDSEELLEVGPDKILEDLVRVFSAQASRCAYLDVQDSEQDRDRFARLADEGARLAEETRRELGLEEPR